ncbi:GNAT family N-acetyltransferase [Alteromonas ponticola]|uniref:GNAT family N-acetyltransferase n=1 Tax=Alteromonas ponticola TaxID=2720613 RepID=A0ABX1R413_9ALTE|nr:N-acetyltransferase [Alteromonas ponticola]NMH61173.1 GNAT family N-acetyltransferase [Alteromonas ponticola]
MDTNITIREFKESDLKSVKQIINDNQMFPSEYLDDMVSGFLKKETEELWFVSETDENEVISIAYCAPERMTEGTWNLLLIAISKKMQGRGIGSDLVAHVEQDLKLKDARILLVETSGLPDYTLTRNFYSKCGFTQIAVIPEYYDDSDDKIVFWKLLK